CKGTPQPNNTDCDDHNPCTKNDKCLSGHCSGQVDIAQQGMPCVSSLGDCMLDPVCNFGVCLGSFKACPDVDGDKCTVDFCNPATGQCTTVTNTCAQPCSTGTCNSSTGQCEGVTPAPVTQACDEGDVCSATSHCDGAGQCVYGGSGPSPTRTRTPTSGSTSTRTATPASTATRTTSAGA